MTQSKSKGKGGMQALNRKPYPAGAPIFSEGDPGNAAYIVQSGKVEIWVLEGDEKKILGVIGQGGIFGEMALIDNTNRMASATTIEETVCIAIPDRVFKEKLAKADSFIVALLRIFCNNIRSMQQTDDADTVK